MPHLYDGAVLIGARGKGERIDSRRRGDEGDAAKRAVPFSSRIPTKI